MRLAGLLCVSGLIALSSCGDPMLRLTTINWSAGDVVAGDKLEKRIVLPIERTGNWTVRRVASSCSCFQIGLEQVEASREERVTLVAKLATGSSIGEVRYESEFEAQDLSGKRVLVSVTCAGIVHPRPHVIPASAVLDEPGLAVPLRLVIPRIRRPIDGLRILTSPHFIDASSRKGDSTDSSESYELAVSWSQRSANPRMRLAGLLGEVVVEWDSDGADRPLMIRVPVYGHDAKVRSFFPDNIIMDSTENSTIIDVREGAIEKIRSWHGLRAPDVEPVVVFEVLSSDRLGVKAIRPIAQPKALEVVLGDSTIYILMLPSPR